MRRRRGNRAAVIVGATLSHTVAAPGSGGAKWKRAFDSDPIGRERAGVRGFRIGRSVESPNRVIVDLELEELDAARAMLEKLRVMWNQVEGTVMSHVQAQIVEVVEERRKPED